MNNEMGEKKIRFRYYSIEEEIFIRFKNHARNN